MENPPVLLIGLGNPGKKYNRTRHNVGFMALDHFVQSNGPVSWQEKFSGRYCRCRLHSRVVLCGEPLTFMNRSGRFVAPLARFYKIPLSHILVLHDDLDLDFGRIKAVARGGSGGHNGIRSLIAELGGSDFARIKIGIGRPVQNEQGYAVPIDHFVLSPFTGEEEKQLGDIFDRIDLALNLFVQEGIAACMNFANRK
jgi:PTH1 family peptidyl-tRNA hydrolase